MKTLNYILKFLLWSAVVSVGIRIIYGMYFGFAALSLCLAAIIGIVGGFLLSTATTAKFAAATVAHIGFVSALSLIYDYSGFLRSLPYDSALYFMNTSGSGGRIVSLIWPIITVTPVYFVVFIAVSAIILAVHHRRADLEEAAADAQSDENCGDEDYYE